MTLDQWLQVSIQDAERRGLPALRPLLEGLARSTAALRAASWNQRVPVHPEQRDGRASGDTTEGGR